MKNRVLINGDDLNAISILKSAFENESYIVFCEYDSKKVLERIRDAKPDITILIFDTHINLSVCRDIKRKKNYAGIALLIIGSSSEDKHDIIEGLRLGVEDYVTRPFDPDIFLAKVRAIMRRLAYKKEPDEILKYKNLEINLSAHTVSIDKKPVELTPKELVLLYYLVSKKNTVLSREFLMEHIWEQEYLGDPRTVNKHIETLRRKTGDLASKIETIKGMGYKFTA